MPFIRVEVADSGLTREVEDREETVYTITISGVLTINLSLTPTEYQWLIDDLYAERKAAESLLDRARSERDPQDPAPYLAQIDGLRRQLILAAVVRELAGLV